MRIFFVRLSILGAALLAGCATITRGTTEVLIIESDPVGADVRIAPAGVSCKTPCSIELKRKHNQLVTIRKEGYEPVDVNVIPQTSGAGGAGMAGNVLVGGLIGAAVDAGSGAMKDLKPNPVKVTLVAVQIQPVAAAAPAQPPASPAVENSGPTPVPVSNSPAPIGSAAPAPSN